MTPCSRATAASRVRRALICLVAFVPCVARASAQEPDSALTRDLVWRNIGPANMAGRVTDIEAVERNPAIVYVAAASGGLWKSANAGTTWTPIFTRYGTANMGDVAVFQADPRIVWVGTGESCVRNSAGWGDGVYRSTDGGQTFTNVGLRETHHISEVVTHPRDPAIAYVAAQGHLWAHTGERGIFKTVDGGRTWRRLVRGLPDDGRTGASDLVMDPRNPEVLYAGFWERLREPHRFTSGGPNGGIFKTTDGGATWSRLGTGLPPGPTGKIGLAIARTDPRVLMAIVEHGRQPARGTAAHRDMTTPGSGLYRSEDGGASWRFVHRHTDRPFYYSHVAIDPRESRRVYVLAGSALVSEDGGRTFARRLDGIAGDFHALWIDPAGSDRFYVGNDKGAYVTYDRGQHFQMFDNMDIGQFYGVAVDHRDPYWIYGGLQDNGNWGGPSNSRDANGVLNDHWFKFHAGDGFHTRVDPEDWRTVYTEAQNGRLRRLDAVFRQRGSDITPNAGTVLDLTRVLPHGPTRGRLPPGTFRFNWSAPFILSPHDPATLYVGGNHLFRSTDRGDTWTIASPDLSTGDPALTDPSSGGLTRDVTGAETHATAVTIAESPRAAGLLWVGTDDGNVQLTVDGGTRWTNLRERIPGVPARTWVSRIEASRFDRETAYVTFDGHRRNDFAPYVFKTTDLGRTWTDLSEGLPAGAPVYVIKEDTRNPSLLYVGTEQAVYVSLDGGRRWQRLMQGMPTVPVYDLVVHPRDGDLIAATHGRSIWVLDDVGPLQQLTDSIRAADVHLFRSRTATAWHGVTRGATRGHMLFAGRNPLTITQTEPSNAPLELESAATIDFYLRRPPAEKVVIEISDPRGRHRFTRAIDAHAGINRFYWKLRFDPPGATDPVLTGGGATLGDDAVMPTGQARGVEAGPGEYRVRLLAEGRTAVGTVTVRSDPALDHPEP